MSGFFSFWYVAIVWIKIIFKTSESAFFQFLVCSNCLNKNYSQIVGVCFFQFLVCSNCLNKNCSQNVGCPLFSDSGIWPLWIKFSKHRRSAFFTFWHLVIVWIKIVLKTSESAFFTFWYVAIVWIKIILKLSESAFFSFWHLAIVNQILKTSEVRFFHFLACSNCLNKNYSQIVEVRFFHFLACSNCLNKNYFQIIGVCFSQFLASGHCEPNYQNIGGPLFSLSGM